MRRTTIANPQLIKDEFENNDFLSNFKLNFKPNEYEFKDSLNILGKNYLLYFVSRYNDYYLVDKKTDIIVLELHIIPRSDLIFNAIQTSCVSKNPDIITDKNLALEFYRYLLFKLKHVIISDKEHYLGGRALWKNLAKKKDIYIYAINSDTRNFYLDENGKLLRLTFKNLKINNPKIWYKEKFGENILLVASEKPLKGR